MFLDARFAVEGYPDGVPGGACLDDVDEVVADGNLVTGMTPEADSADGSMNNILGCQKLNCSDIMKLLVQNIFKWSRILSYHRSGLCCSAI